MVQNRAVTFALCFVMACCAWVAFGAEDDNIHLHNAKDFKAAMASLKSNSPSKPDLHQFQERKPASARGHRERNEDVVQKKKQSDSQAVKKKKHAEFADVAAMFGNVHPSSHTYFVLVSCVE